ncbi:hypothetical protein GCM10018962_32170 [Dactylosporangium matsuzakiense]|uniref:Uncharacterized protein n=2 Tax=Dactylosporangium matsuzakiense TaxID=53360 RepID=A0A9W6KNU9_9ACTN|nr:hypothetical protein GCM10017581_044810 [Dactylosporangium matsuzakiense]
MVYRTGSPGWLSVIRTVIRVIIDPRQLGNSSGSALTVTDTTRGGPGVVGAAEVGRAGLELRTADGWVEAVLRTAVAAGPIVVAGSSGTTGCGVLRAAVGRGRGSSPVVRAARAVPTDSTMTSAAPARNQAVRRERPSGGGAGNPPPAGSAFAGEACVA